jgi:membrane protease YdiL (CAAX protease family)
VVAIWAAAALPMAVLAWIVAPAVAGTAATDRRFVVTLIGALTCGLAWQCVLVVLLVAREQRSLRWPVVRDALWLRPPSDPAGRRGGRLWLWTVPFVLGFGVLQLIPFGLSGPSNHDFGAFLGSAEGRDTLRGNWALFALILVLFLFNTVLGEELLFRGVFLFAYPTTVRAGMATATATSRMTAASSPTTPRPTYHRNWLFETPDVR